MASRAAALSFTLALASIAAPCAGFAPSPLLLRSPMLGRSSFRASVPRTASLRGNVGRIVMQDFPKPNLENTDNYRIANQLSSKFTATKGKMEKKKVAIIGGGELVDPKK